MSAKSESLPTPKALMRLTLGEQVKLHWPDGSIEAVIVVGIEHDSAKVERSTWPNYFDTSHHADVPREWLRPIKNA